MKKPTFRYYWFFDEVYGEDILLLVGDAAKANRFMLDKYNIILNWDSCGARTSAGRTKDGAHIITVWLPEYKNNSECLSFLAHEAVHAALFVFDRVGIRVNGEDSEPMAYYVQMIMRKFLEFLKA